MNLDARLIQQQITSLLSQYPEIAEDDTLRADSVEGQTDAFSFLEILVRKIGENKARIEGIKSYRKELADRCARFERRDEALRSLAFKIMQTAELKWAELNEATLSIANSQPKVLITDEAIIPDILCKIQRTPDKSRIKEMLKAGEIVRGAVLSNQEPHLVVRTK